jgi:hypothetical protein
MADDECQARAALIAALLEGLALQHAGHRRRRFSLTEMDALARRSFSS